MSRVFVIAFFVLAFLSPTTSRALEGTWVRSGAVQVRLVSAVDGTGDGTTISAAIEIRLDPGWKTYWRSPGDAGLPPVLDWSASENVGGAEVSFPAPRRFKLQGFETFGYEGGTVWPVRVRLARGEGAVGLRLRADLSLCSDICVPERVSVSLRVPAGPARPGDGAETVARARAGLPDDGRLSGLALTRAEWERGTLTAVIEGDRPFVAPDLLVETTPPRSFFAPVFTFEGSGRVATARIAPAEGYDPPPPGSALTVTVIDGDRAAEFNLRPVAAAPGAGNLAAAAAAGLGGGLILNLMPCVLPVLSLKLLAILAAGGRGRRAVRRGFLASAAGIVSVFLVLASALIAARAGGVALGWGAQFQSPVFVAAMFMMALLFALNLFDRFEIRLPGPLADRLGGEAGDFAAGAFAALLSTPCSAPLVGTAAAFALAGGAVDILVVFAALGVGLAAPWILAAAWPGFVRFLPRPGRWMIGLRRVMGVFMLLTAVWLAWALVGVAGWIATATVAGAAAAAVGVAWSRVRWRGGLIALAGASALICAGLVAGADGAPRPRAETRWDADEARSLVAQGRVVLLEVSADWCLTCLVNERRVLESDPTARLLKDRRVVVMRADWTRGDPAVFALLTSWGRRGVPFTMVMGPRAPAGIALSEFLTHDEVAGAVREAERGG